MSPDGGDGGLPAEDRGGGHRGFRADSPAVSEPVARGAADADVVFAADGGEDDGVGGLAVFALKITVGYFLAVAYLWKL